MTPKISIIIPVYNVEKYIRQALDSVVNQTLTDIEIICVNDCTPDKSFEIVKEYASKDSRFVLLEQETNQGPGVARNRALDVAKGDYIMFLDPDDWYELDACEKAYNQIYNNKNDFVTFNAYKYFEKTNKKKLYDYRIEPYRKCINNPRIKLSELDNDFIRTPYTWAQVYSRDFINKNNIRYTHEKLSEDLYFWIKAIISANTISIIETPLYNYRVRGGSATQSYSSNWKDLFNTRYRCLELLHEYEVACNYINAFIIFNINSLFIWDKKAIRNIAYHKNFYPEMKKMFQYFKREYDLSEVNLFINCKRFDCVCNMPWCMYFVTKPLRKIFF